MNDYSLVHPMFAMVVLTFAVLLKLFVTRLRFVRQGEVHVSYFKLYRDGVEPEAATQLARHFVNLFEAPTLFYVACVSAMVAGQSSALMTVLAWLYVGLRAIHTFIHTGRNTLNHRIAAYFASWGVLLAMWIGIVVGVAGRGL